MGVDVQLASDSSKKEEQYTPPRRKNVLKSTQHVAATYSGLSVHEQKRPGDEAASTPVFPLHIEGIGRLQQRPRVRSYSLHSFTEDSARKLVDGADRRALHELGTSETATAAAAGQRPGSEGDRRERTGQTAQDDMIVKSLWSSQAYMWPLVLSLSTTFLLLALVAQLVYIYESVFKSVICL
jgi:hypothetical protein